MIDMRRPRSRPRETEPFDEYDLGDRFRRWAKQTSSRALTFAIVHPKPLVYSTLAVLSVGVGWWIVAHHRPAQPPPPAARPMQQMMRAIEEADQRIRAQQGERMKGNTELRGVFETMRDMPVPISAGSQAGAGNSESQVPKEQP